MLTQGDVLYVGIKNQLVLDESFQNNYLTVEEMSKQVLTDINLYNVFMPNVRCGYIKAQEGGSVGWLTLAQQLQCLSTDVSHDIIIASPECIAVFRDRSGRY